MKTFLGVIAKVKDIDESKEGNWLGKKVLASNYLTTWYLFLLVLVRPQNNVEVVLRWSKKKNRFVLLW